MESRKHTGPALLLFGLAAMLFLFAGYLQSGTPADFMNLYLAGKMIAGGHRHELYNYSLQMSTQASFTKLDVPRPFIRPPFEAPLFAPLALLSYREAYVIWEAINLLTIGVALYLLRSVLAEIGWLSRLALAGAMFYPLISTLAEGQDTPILLLLYVLAFLSFKTGRDFLAGCALAAGLFRFQMVLPLLAALGAMRRWSAVAGAAAVASAEAAVSLALVGPSVFKQYLGILLFVGQSYDLDYFSAMPNLRGLTFLLPARWLETWIPQAAVIFSSLALLALLIGTWIRVGWDPGGSRFDLLFSLMVVVSLLVCVHSFMHNMILLALPLAMTLGLPVRWPLVFTFGFFAANLAINVLLHNQFVALLAPVLVVFAFLILGVIRKAEEPPRAGCLAAPPLQLR